MTAKINSKKIINFIENNQSAMERLDCREDLLKLLGGIDRLWEFLKTSELKFEIRNKSEERKLYQLLNAFFKKAEHFEGRSINKLLIRKIKGLFRDVIKGYLFKSKLLKHGYLKPRGYPGDFRIIEAMYNNKSISSGIGDALDRYFLNNDYVKAVRDRKNDTKLILRKYIRNGKGPINILNLACGSCREIRELLKEGPRVTRNVNFILVDQDISCLRFAKKEIGKHPPNIKFIFIRADIIDFLKRPEAFLRRKLDAQHLIYSIGVADYLPNSILGPLFQRGASLLAKDGHFIVAHKNTRIYASPKSDWGSDWKFIPRDQKALKQIVVDNVDMRSYMLDLFAKRNKLIFYVDLKKYK